MLLRKRFVGKHSTGCQQHLPLKTIHVQSWFTVWRRYRAKPIRGLGPESI
jgi:hypothetical protein